MHVQIEIDLNSVSLFHTFYSFFFLCRSAISITGEWAKTLSGDPFLLRANGNADKMLVFGTSENLGKLADLDTIYVDETFCYFPSLYCQLFTINGFINGQQFPLVYYFLPAKSRADYNRFFTIVKEEMQNLGLIFQPTSDFELALLQALELQFPNTQTLGCLFHFSQCLWRKVQSLGLARKLILINSEA